MKSIEYKPFGTIRIKLDEYLTKNNISTYALAKATALEFKVIKNLRKLMVTRIDFEVLAKICYALEVKIDDILEYQNEIN